MADPITIAITVVKLVSAACGAGAGAAKAIEGFDELSNNNTSSSDNSSTTSQPKS